MENIEDEEILDKNSIKKLISEGYNLNILSLEFDISMEILNQYKKEIEEEKKEQEKEKIVQEQRRKKEKEDKQRKLEQRRKEDEERLIKKDNERKFTVPSRMELLRRKYWELYYKKDEKIEESNNQSKEERKTIEAIIKTIEQKANEIEVADFQETGKLCSDLIEEMNKLNDYNMTIEQLGAICKIVNSSKMDYKNEVGISKKNYHVLNSIRSTIAKRYANTIEKQIDKINDIEGLKKLSLCITAELRNKYYLYFASITVSIYNKIDRLKRESITHTSVPDSVMGIVEGLASGNLNVQNANQVINQEINKRLQNVSKNKFSLSEDEIRQQVYSQIGSELGKNGDKYPIKKLEDTVSLFEQMHGKLTWNNIKSIIENYITGKNFGEAKKILDKYSTQQYKLQNFPEINALGRRIKIEELNDLIMRGIKGEGIHKEEEDAYFKLIEKNVMQGNITLQQISLGMSEDGQRKITLSDIWIGPKPKVTGSR